MSLNSSQKVLGYLAMLAEQCNENVSPSRIEFMTRKLLPLGADRVAVALEKLLESARRFPTVAEVQSAMGITAETVEDKARETAERIWTAIGKFGYTDWKRAQEYVGEIGQAVVAMQGGWISICEIATNDNAGQLKAQWRGLAETLARKNNRGEGNVPPRFDRLSEAKFDTILKLDEKIIDISKVERR